MSWTYGNDPNATGTAAQKRDAIRVLAQINSSTAQPDASITDEEIAFFLVNEANLYMAAYRAALCAAGRTKGIASRTIGSLTIAYGHAFYQDLAIELKARGSSHQEPFVGGISRDDKAVLHDDSDWIAPAMSVVQFDHPEVAPLSTQDVWEQA